MSPGLAVSLEHLTRAYCSRPAKPFRRNSSAPLSAPWVRAPFRHDIPVQNNSPHESTAAMWLAKDAGAIRQPAIGPPIPYVGRVRLNSHWLRVMLCPPAEPTACKLAPLALDYCPGGPDLPYPPRWGWFLSWLPPSDPTLLRGPVH